MAAVIRIVRVIVKYTYVHVYIHTYIHTYIYSYIVATSKPCIWQKVEGLSIDTIKFESEHSKSLEPSTVGKRTKNSSKINTCLCLYIVMHHNYTYHKSARLL